VNLEAQLELLAEDVQFPEAPDFSASIAASLTPRIQPVQWPRRFLLAAAVLALLLIGAVSIPESRTALAKWLGLGGIRIEFVDTLLDRDDRVEIDSALIVGEEIELGEAELTRGIAVKGLPDKIPMRVYERIDGSVTTVSLVYEPSATLPEIGETGVGALLMQTDAPGEFVFLVKETHPMERASFVQVGGTDGYWVQTGNLVAIPFDPAGEFGLDQVSRRTGNVLLWQVGGITYRLETNLSRAEAIALAESLVPVGSAED
jgi:hypothetical protein